MRKEGAALAEGYPARNYQYGKSIPAAFAWTGTLPLFEKAGFEPVGSRSGGRQRMRKSLE